MSNILPVDHHFAGVRIIEPLQQCEDGGLAGSGSTHETDFLSRRHVEREIIEHCLTARVTEPDVADTYRAAADRKRRGVRCVLHFMRQAEYMHRLPKLRE